VPLEPLPAPSGERQVASGIGWGDRRSAAE
jgi:hypothetical protein